MWLHISHGEERRRDEARGFTLLEVLIAMVILAIVLTTAYRVFSSSYSALHQLDPDQDLFHTARVILDRMTDEIQSAYYRPDLGYTGFVGEDDENEQAPWDSLSFSAMANFYWIKRIEGIKESDFLKIYYTLIQDEENEEKTLLIRRQDPALGPFEGDIDEAASELRGVHLLTDNVWGVDFRYFDGSEWVDDWNSDETKKAPRAVEVKLILKTDDGQRVPFYSVIPIGVSQIMGLQLEE
jgi:general secretion pathway protein J